MKKYLFLIMGMLCAFADVRGQAPQGLALHPVAWHYRVEPLGKGWYALHITALISPGWHLYAQHQPEEAVAIPTAIRFNKDSVLYFKGVPAEKGRLEHYAWPAMDIADNRYSGRVEFIQEIRLLGKSPAQLSGDITYQVCREEECLPPAVTRFSIRLPG